MVKKVWLVTGANRGIGRAIAEYAVSQGDFVAAGARPGKGMTELATWVESNPAQTLAVQLDMNQPADFGPAIQQILQKFGRIDVLVNNAGYGLQGFVEEIEPEQSRGQMETNFFGLLELTRKVIPVMRGQQSGYIFNIASIAGLRGGAGFGLYNASKFAVVGLSEALAQELAPFGIHVSAVEPGPYRTDWAGNSLQRSEAMRELDENSPYAQQNQAMKAMLDARSGNQPGDPNQIASVLFSATRKENLPVHMVFGDLAVDWWKQKMVQYGDTTFMQYFPHERNQI